MPDLVVFRKSCSVFLESALYSLQHNFKVGLRLTRLSLVG